MVAQAPYSVIKKLGPLEIRHYPPLVLAEVESSYENSGFNMLFNYINGANTTQQKIPMTAPVINSEKIPMTAPVITKQNTMAFVLPKHYTPQTAPQPTNPKIIIRAQDQKTYAVLRFSGKSTEKSVKEHTKMLNDALIKHQLKALSSPLLMRYNSPFAPGFLRRNELAIEIKEP